MSKQVSVALADITSQAANAAVNVGDLEDATLFVGGTISGTYKVSESPDGTLYVDTYSGKTAAGIWPLSTGTRFVKVTVTAFTSGILTSVVGGRDTELMGA